MDLSPVSHLLTGFICAPFRIRLTPILCPSHIYLCQNLERALSACSSRGLCPSPGEGYTGIAVFFVYPYVFVAGPNKHD